MTQLNPGAHTQVDQLLAACHNWQFDAFALAEATSGHALSTLG